MKKLLFLLPLFLLLIAAPNVLAQEGITNPVIGNLGNDAAAAASGSTFQVYFIYLWQALITVGGLAVLIYFIWGAIEWITAGGDSGKVQKARDKITQSVIGLVVLVGSFVIITWVSRIFFGENFDILELQFNDPRGTGSTQNSGGAEGAVRDGLNSDPNSGSRFENLGPRRSL